MSKQHTPGPWTHSPFVPDRESYIYGLAPDGFNRPRIACVAFGLSCGNDIVAETEANARLIAAAPDLLEALEWARNYHGDRTETGRAHTLAKINAAIVRARGAA